MSFHIIWTPLAIEDYLDNIEYLENHWSEKVVNQFIDKVDYTLDLLKKGNTVFKNSNYMAVFELPIIPQIQLFYRFINSNTIELLRFWNNKRDPKGFYLR